MKQGHNTAISNEGLRPREKILQDLELDGISLIPSLFSPGLISCAREKALSLELESDRAGVRRIFQEAHLVDEFRFFFGCELFPSLFSKLIGPGATPRKNSIQSRIDNNIAKSPIVTFHIDAITPRYKVFLYLSDVGEEDGPLEYFMGTHAPHGWREAYCRELREALTKYGAKGDYLIDYSGCLKTPEDLSWVAERFTRARVIAPEGTCIIFDTRGFHRASPLGCGNRLILSMHWLNEHLPL